MRRLETTTNMIARRRDEMTSGAVDDDDSFSLDLDDIADAEAKLNLARSLIQMDDMDGARLALEEVLLIGTDTEIDEAHALLEQLS